MAVPARPCKKHPLECQQLLLRVRRASDSNPQGALHTVYKCQTCKNEWQRQYYPRNKTEQIRRIRARRLIKYFLREDNLAAD